VLAGLVVFLGAKVFPDGVVAGLVVLLLVATNRGFHLDALADTFDALAVTSTGDPTADRVRRLSVMKDSTTGAVGVVAIVLATLMKYLCAAALFDRYDVEGAAYLLFLMPVFSRWAMIPAMAHGRAARPEGLGKVFVERTGPVTVLVASLVLAAVYVGATLPSSVIAPVPALAFFFLACLCLYAFSLLWALFCSRRFGGLTGDTSGAVAEMSDVLFLLLALLFF
jgi:adenosylcobinamide-GDP ribazoletransferase